MEVTSPSHRLVLSAEMTPPAPDIYNTTRPVYLLSRNLNVIVAVTVTFIAVTTFTVLANCTIIAAVLRGCVYGVTVKPSRPVQLTNGRSTPGQVQVVTSISAARNGQNTPRDADISRTSRANNTGITHQRDSDDGPVGNCSANAQDCCRADATAIVETSREGRTKGKLKGPCRNTEICHVTPHTPKKRTRPLFDRDNNSISVVLMVSMAVTDLVLGACVLPMSVLEIAYNGRWVMGGLTCQVHRLLDMLLSTASIYHVVSMAGDRYLAVCWPFLHQRLTLRTAKILVAVCWVVPILVIFALLATEAFTVEVKQCLIEDSPGEGGVDHCIIDDRSINVISNESQTLRTSSEVNICAKQFTMSGLILSVILDFYVPFFIIILLYFLILLELRRMFKRRMVLFNKNNVQKDKYSDTGSGNQKIYQMSHEACKHDRHQHCEMNEKQISPCHERVDLLPYATIHEGNATYSPDKHPLADRLPNSGVIHMESSFTASAGSRAYNLGKKVIKQPINSAHGRRHAKTSRLTVTQDLSNDETTDCDVSQIQVNISTSSSSDYRPPNHGASPYIGHGDLRLKLKEGRPTVSAEVTSKSWSREGRDRPNSRSLKIVRTIGLVVVAFAVCWLPFSIGAVVVRGQLQMSIPSSWFMLSAAWLGYINSSLNPLLYCGHTTMKAALRDLLCGGS